MRFLSKTLPKTFLLALVIHLLLATGAKAAFWRCELPGGVFLVNLATLTSVSIHEYVVDGAARVTELTIGTTGAVVGRFYYIEPLTPQTPGGVGQSILDKVQQKSTEAANRAGVEEVWKKVVKNYPLTTHAHTVEYRLESVDQLKKVQSNLETAWRNNTDTKLKISGSDGSGGVDSGN